MRTCSIVIPVYKSTNSLEIIADDVNKLGKESESTHFELIFVNDSPENTETVSMLQKISESYGNVRVITLHKNIGQHLALLIGLKHAVGEYIVTMDDDLQHPVGEVPKLLDAIMANDKPDAVFGVPGYANKKHSLWRNAGSYILNRIDSFFLAKPKNLKKSPYRIMTSEIKDVIVKNYNAMPSISSLLINATSNIKNIKVDHHKRAFGKSHYTFRKLISLTLNNVIHYSSLPLKVLGTIGLLGFIFSVFFIIFTFIQRLFMGITLPGYASTVILISFFGGLNLLAMGIIGEYLIRIIREQQKWGLDDHIKRIDE